MIIYNFRYRGPFEYDKFVLNALQLKNQINYLLKIENSTNGLNSYKQEIESKLESAEQQCHDIYMALADYWRY